MISILLSTLFSGINPKLILAVVMATILGLLAWTGLHEHDLAIRQTDALKAMAANALAQHVQDQRDLAAITQAGLDAQARAAESDNLKNEIAALHDQTHTCISDPAIRTVLAGGMRINANTSRNAIKRTNRTAHLPKSATSASR